MREASFFCLRFWNLDFSTVICYLSSKVTSICKLNYKKLRNMPFKSREGLGIFVEGRLQYAVLIGFQTQESTIDCTSALLKMHTYGYISTSTPQSHHSEPYIGIVEKEHPVSRGGRYI